MNAEQLTKALQEGIMDTQVSERQPQVDSEFAKLENEIGDLREVITKLESRLVGVMSDTPGTALEEGETKDMVLCPLADALRDQRYRLSGAKEDVLSILRRLEV